MDRRGQFWAYRSDLQFRCPYFPLDMLFPRIFVPKLLCGILNNSMLSYRSTLVCLEKLLPASAHACHRAPETRFQADRSDTKNAKPRLNLGSHIHASPNTHISPHLHLTPAVSSAHRLWETLNHRLDCALPNLSNDHPMEESRAAWKTTQQAQTCCCVTGGGKALPGTWGRL